MWATIGRNSPKFLRGLAKGQRFDQDRLRQLGADGQSRITDLADDVGLAGDELDDLFLAEADLAEAIPDFGRRGQLFDPNGHAGSGFAQRTNKGRVARRLPGAARDKFNGRTHSHREHDGQGCAPALHIGCHLLVIFCPPLIEERKQPDGWHLA